MTKPRSGYDGFRVLFGMLLGFSFFWIVHPQLSWAARSAVVKTDEIMVYELPNNQSSVLGKIKKGERLNVSNLDTDGYHRVKFKDKLAWVEGDQLDLSEPPSEEQVRLEAAPYLPKKDVQDKKGGHSKRGPAIGPVRRMRRSVHLNLSGGLEMMGLAGVLASQAKLGQGYGFGGEFSYSLSDEWSIVFRGEYLINLNALVSGLKTYQINLSTIPVSLGPQFSFNGDYFSVSIGLLGGALISPSLSSAVQNADTRLFRADPAFMFLGRVLAEWQATKWFALILEAGYRYGVTSNLTTLTSTPDTSTEILASTPILDFSGPVLHAGVSFGF